MRERGFALVGALLAVVLLGALIVGAFVATTEEVRISGNVGAGALALTAAESVVERDLSAWAAAQVDSLPPAGRVSHSTGWGVFSVTTTLVRLDSTVYWLVADAIDGLAAPGASPAVRRRIGVLLRRVCDSTGKATLFRLEERPWSELF